MVLMQPWLLALLRRSGQAVPALRKGFVDLWKGLVLSARNMIGIAVACASAGLIVGAIAGYVGGLWDELLMRITELFMAFPTIILAMANPTPEIMPDEARDAGGASRRPATLRVLRASAEELRAHAAQIERIDKACGGTSVWKKWLAGS